MILELQNKLANVALKYSLLAIKKYPMVQFINFAYTYDPLTTQGLNEKVINISEIAYITFFTESPNKRVNSVKSRIKLKNGEMFDVKESRDQILKLILVLT